MKAKKYWIVVVLVALSCATAIICVAATAGNLSKTSVVTSQLMTFHVIGRNSLAGLEEIKVIVEQLKPEAKKYGLTTQELQTDVELQLRQYGIRVLSPYEKHETPSYPTLSLRIAIIINEEIKVAAGAIDLELSQTVLLRRDTTKVFVDAPTWQQIGVWLVGVNNLKDVRKEVKDYVDVFINDYLAANPKEHSTDEKAPWRIEAKVGQDFVIDLLSNPSTGYSWRLARPLPSMLKLQRKRYIPPKVQKLGGGGTEEWTFKSVRSGKATIMFEYIRPWEKDSLPARERIFSVVAK